MKFKAIFALFNGVLVVSFLLIFFMPLILLGVEAFSIFWDRNWIIALVFLLTMGVLNAYFIVNWGLFRLLEKEDWPRLVSYLEDRILGKNQIRAMPVRMLLNAYLVTSHTDGILALEAFLKKKRPRLVGRFCIQFGIPYLLMKDPVVSEAFFADIPAGANANSRDWMRWNRAFCLLQLSKPDQARMELAHALEGSAGDLVLRLLCLYLLDVLAKPETEDGVESARSRAELRRKFGPEEMKRKIEKSSDNMEVVVLSKIIEDARQWLYSDPIIPSAKPEAPLPADEARDS
jgi:hypothetical protein